MVFFISKYKAIFKLRGFFLKVSLTIFLYKQKLTWQVDFEGVKNYMQLCGKN